MFFVNISGWPKIFNDCALFNKQSCYVASEDLSTIFKNWNRVE